ncbi:MAG: RDD family protein [Thermoleophilia bacterium]
MTAAAQPPTLARVTGVVWRRIGAGAIDLVLFVAIMAITFFSVSDTRAEITCAISQGCVKVGSRQHVVQGGAAWVFMLVFVAVWLIHYGVVQGITGATAGKRLLDLRVVRADGAVCGVPRALLRTVILLVAWVVTWIGFTLVAVVELAQVLSTRSHQRIGDRWARTYVVRAGDVGRPIPVDDWSRAGGAPARQ